MDKPVVKIYGQNGQARTLEQKVDKDTMDSRPKVVVHWESPEDSPVDKLVVMPDRDTATVDTDSTEEKIPQTHIPKDDKDFEALIIRQGELYRQRSKLSNELVDIAFDSTQAERKVIVDQILAKVSEYNKLAEAKRFYEKHGKWPEQPEIKKKISDTEKQELLKQIQNIRSNISKAKKAVEKYQHQPTKVQKYQVKKARLEMELQYAEELIRQ